MVRAVIISRKSDGLVFCEVLDADDNDKNLKFIRSKAHDFLKGMQSKQDLCTVNIDSQNFVFHYKINENIVYLVIAEVKYPAKLAFCFLEELNTGFTEELKNQFGTQSVSYYSKLETVDRANYFLKFEKFIKKKRLDYLDSSSKSNIEKLNREIMDVHQIMAENISLIIDREKTFSSIHQMSETIKDDSDKFSKLAYQTRIRLLLAKYSIFIAIAVILLLIVIFKYYF